MVDYAKCNLILMGISNWSFQVNNKRGLQKNDTFYVLQNSVVKFVLIAVRYAQPELVSWSMYSVI
jgi:hypothetical protein